MMQSLKVQCTHHFLGIHHSVTNAKCIIFQHNYLFLFHHIVYQFTILLAPSAKRVYGCDQNCIGTASLTSLLLANLCLCKASWSEHMVLQ